MTQDIHAEWVEASSISSCGSYLHCDLTYSEDGVVMKHACYLAPPPLPEPPTIAPEVESPEQGGQAQEEEASSCKVLPGEGNEVQICTSRQVLHMSYM